jgi:hypothetical protein
MRPDGVGPREMPLQRWRESGIDVGRAGFPGLAEVVLSTRTEAEQQAYREGLEQGRRDRAAGVTEPGHLHNGTRPLGTDA